MYKSQFKKNDDWLMTLMTGFVVQGHIYALYTIW